MSIDEEKITDVEPAAHGSQGLPQIWDRAGMLNRVMDDEELARVLIDSFLGDIPRQIESLKGDVESGNASGARLQAHTIKGAASNMGADALHAMACKMEQAAEAGDLGAVKTGLDDLWLEFSRVKQAMEGF